MGKKRIATQEGQLVDADKRARALSRTAKKKITTVVLSIEATFNNTKAVVSDTKGNVLFWSSSGSLGFKGAKKGTATLRAIYKVGKKKKIEIILYVFKKIRNTRIQIFCQ